MNSAVGGSSVLRDHAHARETQRFVEGDTHLSCLQYDVLVFSRQFVQSYGQDSRAATEST